MTPGPSKSEEAEIWREVGQATKGAEDEYNFAESAEKVATGRGLVVVLPEPNQLQIDLDDQAAYDVFCDRLDQFDICNGVAGVQIVVKESASGFPHRYVVLTFGLRGFSGFREFSEPERIALQFALGSDPVRERLNVMRLWFGVDNPTRLFEKPDAIPS